MGNTGYDLNLLNHTKGGRVPAGEDAQWSRFAQADARIGGFFDFQGDDQGSPIQYLYKLLNRKWTIAAVFVLGVAVAAFIAFTSTPYFVSTSTLEVSKTMPSSGSLNDVVSAFGQYDVYYQTQVEALKSRGLALKFIRKMKQEARKESVVAKSPTELPDKAAAAKAEEIPGKAGSQRVTGTAVDSASSKINTSKELTVEEERSEAASVGSVLSRVTIRQIPGTQMIQADMGASDPILARRMLQVYLDTFMDDNRAKREALGAKIRTWLNKELGETQKLLASSQEDLIEFTKKHGIVAMDKNPNTKIGAFERAGDELVRSKTERLSMEALEYERQRALPAQVTDDYLKALKDRLASLKAEYTGMTAIYSPEYFKMALLRNKMKAVETAITEAEKGNLESAVSSARKKETLTQEAYEKAKQEALDMNSLTVNYNILRKAVDANEKLYLVLLEKSKQAEMDHGISGPQIIVTSPPSLPIAPVKPRKGKIMFIGAIVGLLGGIALAFCLELLDRTVQSTQEIQERLKLPILGAVPILERDKGLGAIDTEGQGLEFMAYRFPSSPFTDSIRIVHNAASSFLPTDAGSTMLVTSALPLEGKTLLSVVMGTVIASEHKRVLIIDGDMRSPRIHQVFQGDPGDVGLSELLTGKALKLREAIRQSHVPGLYYMPAGSRPDNPVALLKNRRIESILEACRKVFDVVILDAPPILGLVDARILGGYTDGLILVTRAGHTPIEVLKEAREAVYQGQGRLLGIVLNMADHRKGYGPGYYYNRKYYSRYYHRYYHQDPKSSTRRTGGNGARQPA